MSFTPLHAPSYIQEVSSGTLKARSKSMTTSLSPSQCCSIFGAQSQDTSAFWHCCQSHAGLRFLGRRTGIISVFAPLLSQTLEFLLYVQGHFYFQFQIPPGQGLYLLFNGAQRALGLQQRLQGTGIRPESPEKHPGKRAAFRGVTRRISIASFLFEQG